MVLFKTALGGFCILLVGVLLVSFLGQYVTVELRQVQNRTVEPHSEFLVGDLVDRTYTLPTQVAASGSVKVTQAPTNASAEIRFLVFDDANYQKWVSGQPADNLYSNVGQGQFIFNFTTIKTGAYHFVFDNRASLFKKYVVLSIGYSEVTKTNVPDPRVPYLAWGLIVAGALILAYGFIRKPPIRWA